MYQWGGKSRRSFIDFLMVWLTVSAQKVLISLTLQCISGDEKVTDVLLIFDGWLTVSVCPFSRQKKK